MNTQPQYITNANGDKTAVILSMGDYQELMEDLEDLAAIAEIREEETTPWEQVKMELSEHGLL